MAKKQNFLTVLFNGLINENPTFVLLLGMCPTLGVSLAGVDGLTMGLATTAVLVCSNLIISLLRNFIPDKVRIPSFIVIIATFVTIVDLLMQAFFPTLYSDSLSTYIPLITVNCLIFARAESFASKNGPVLAVVDGIGSGLGFTVAITLLSVIRELLGAGKIFGLAVMPESFQPMEIMLKTPGGFIALGALLLLFDSVKRLVQKQAAGKEAQA